MLRRELRKALRSPLTWAVAALSALLIGHGFVLAVDLFSAGSRSVAAGSLLAQQFDPLAGLVRPSLGGAYFALSLLGPLVACRAIAIEKERRTWAWLLMMRGSALAVVGSAGAASLAATLLPLGMVVGLWLGWLAAGGHLGARETMVALSGHALYGGWLVMLSLAVSAWAKSWAQAAATALVVVMGSWALDSSTGFAALAWLSKLERLSPSVQLLPFERGAFAIGPALFFLLSGSGLFGVAWAGARIDLQPRTRAALSLVLLGAGTFGAIAGTRATRVFDLTEASRLSLPAAQVEGLRALPGPILVEVELDRDDARRQQLEREFLFQLQLARPDVELRFPRDGRPAVEAERDEGYGTVRLTVAGATRETLSNGADELTALLFEAASRPIPEGAPVDYPGWPLVIEGSRRTCLLLLSYLGLPGALAAISALCFRAQRRRT